MAECAQRYPFAPALHEHKFLRTTLAILICYLEVPQPQVKNEGIKNYLEKQKNQTAVNRQMLSYSTKSKTTARTRPVWIAAHSNKWQDEE